MSLLLKALKQAEAANSDKADTGHRVDGDLDLEPLSPPDTAQGREWVEPPGLLFGSGGLAPEPRCDRGFSWPRPSLVPLTPGLAAVVALGYGIYLYFALQPPDAAAPPPPVAASPAAAADQPAESAPATLIW